jgi:hypothetical protein
MANCAKCGRDIGPGEGTVRRVNVGSVGGQPVERDSLVCPNCAKTQDRTTMLFVAIFAIIAALVAIQYFFKVRIF